MRQDKAFTICGPGQAKRKRIASSRSVARTVRKKPHLSATPGSEHEHEHEHEHEKGY
jgi:hypothetical protein